MEIVGIFRDGDAFTLATVGEGGKVSGLEIKKNLGDIPPWAVSALSPILVKRFSLPLKTRRAIEVALPFQIEERLPFPKEEALVCPVIREGSVLLFAAQKETLAHHPLDTPFLSCIPMALFRYARAFHPTHTDGIVTFRGQEEIHHVRLEGGELVRYAQGDDERTRDYLGEGVALEVPRHAIAIGLAIDACMDDGVQFRRGNDTHPSVRKELKRVKRHAFLAYGAALGIATLVTVALSSFGQRRVEQTQEALIAEYKPLFPALEGQDVTGIGLALSKVKSVRPKFYTPPKRLAPFLAYLETFKEIDIESLSVELLDYPTLKEPLNRYKAEVRLTFRATPQAAKTFQDHLMAGDQWVDAKEEIGFKRTNHGYQATFILKA